MKRVKYVLRGGTSRSMRHFWLLAALAGCGGAFADGMTPERYYQSGGRVFDHFEKVQGAQKSGPTGEAAVRLKNLWGWDLKGTDGIYGPDYKNSKTVRAENLLSQKRTREQLRAWLANGGDGVPGYGKWMPAAHVDAAATFITAMRDGTIPRSDDIWTLSKGTPGNYKLVDGADPARGKTQFGDTCAGCHGADGTRVVIDGKYSLGAMARSKGYEVWFKILAGHPGSWMRGQVPPGLPRKQAAAFILDTMAGLCDRKAFPAASEGADVPDGDPRCGAYLR